METDIIEVMAIDRYQLFLKFHDGVEGIIDLEKLISFEGIFEPLKEETFFKQVKVQPEWGTIYWPNGADIDPYVLYAEVSGKPVDLLLSHAL